MPSFVTFTHSWFGPRTMKSKTSVNSCIHLMGLARNMNELSIEVNASRKQTISFRQCTFILGN